MDLTNQMPIATKSSKFDISKESDTAKIAKEVSKKIKKGDILFFFGEIGVGKTTFIKYMINNLQKINKVKLTEVPSPTFNLLHEYKVKNLLIEHYDLFRIEKKIDIKNLGILENCSSILTLIEWPEKISKRPKKRIELLFKYKSKSDKRILKINEFR
jgi:tRNA threonylcarbamoyladenosine biosynthesis protein TsaE